MWIRSIEINKFRAFQQQIKINIAQRITCISGHNGIGKSTLLAILSNCGELKRSVGTHLNGNLFRGEFSELVIADPSHDDVKDAGVTISFNDLPQGGNINNSDYVEELHFRAALQSRSQNKKNNTIVNQKSNVGISEAKRYRLIPKKIKDIRNTEAKIAWPTYYLGLSRLYPIGETSDHKTKELRLPPELKKSLLDEHARILSLNYSDTVDMKTINVSVVNKAKSGVETADYISTSNSSGQDNLGQILLTVLSFQELKRKQGNNYYGGILLIDELDATLHPAAQRKLFDYLYQKSIDLDLQIVFTTHSFSLLEHIIDKKKSNSDIEIVYLMNRSNELIQQDNPSIDYIKNELNDIYVGVTKPKKPVKIITEDETARWFINQLFLIHQKDINLFYVDMSISWGHIVNLMLSDTEVYKYSIAILDPDVNDIQKKSNIIEKTRGTFINFADDTKNLNIFIIPCQLMDEETQYPSIEKMLWLYLSGLNDDSHFYRDITIRNDNWHKRIILEHGPLSEDYKNYQHEKCNDTLKYKEWFKNHKEKMNILLSYWVKDNESIVTPFFNAILNSYYYFSKKLN